VGLFIYILHSIDLYSKPHLDIGIVNIDMNALYNIQLSWCVCYSKHP